MAVVIGEDAEALPAIGSDAVPIGQDAEATGYTGTLNTPPPYAPEPEPENPFKKLLEGKFSEAGQAALTNLGSGLEQLKGLVDEAVPGFMDQMAVPISQGAKRYEKNPNDSAPKQLGKAFVNTVNDFADGLTSAQGVALAAPFGPNAGMIGGLAKPVGAAFLASTIEALPKAAQRVKDVYDKPGATTQEKAEADLGLAGTFALTRILSRHLGGFEGGEIPSETKTTQVQQEAGQPSGTQPSQPIPQDFIGAIPTEPAPAESGGASAGEQPAPVRADAGADQGPGGADEIAGASGQGAEGEGGQGEQGQEVTPQPEEISAQLAAENAARMRETEGIVEQPVGGTMPEEPAAPETPEATPPQVSTSLSNNLSSIFKERIKKGTEIPDSAIARVAKLKGIDPDAIRQWIDNGHQPSPEAVAAEAEARLRRAPTPDGGFASHPLVDFIINDVGGLMSKSTARKLWGKERFESNKSLWDSAPEFPDPRHNKIYNKTGGQTPDSAASAAVDAGLLPQGADASDLFQALQKVGDASHRQAAVERGQSVAEKVAGKQANAFARAVAKPARGESAINASDLQIGHTLKIRGENFKVTDIDPDTFDVTIEDGSKFGIQRVANNQVFYGEMKGAKRGTVKPAAAASQRAPAPQPAAALTGLDALRARRDSFAEHSPEWRAVDREMLDFANKLGDVEEKITLKNPRKNWRGVPDAEVKLAAGPDGNWYSTASAQTANGGFGTPFSHSNVYKTVRDAVHGALDQIEYWTKRQAARPDTVKSDQARLSRILEWSAGERARVDREAPKVPESTPPPPEATAPEPPKIPESAPAPVAPETLKVLSSDALRAMLPTADPVTRGRIAWELGNRKPGELGPGAPPPTLRPGEKAGELFQGEDQPFNLAGEKLDESAQKAAEQKAQAEQDRQIHDEENQVPFGFGPGGASIHENLNVGRQISQLNATVSNALKSPRNLSPRAAFTKAFQAVGKQFVTGKQTLQSGLNNVRTAWQTMKTVLMRPPVVADFISALKDWHFADTYTSIKVREFVRNVRKNIKNPLTREAITNYIQADGDMKVLAARAAASNIKYRPGYEAAMKLTPEQQTFAANVRQYFDAMLADGIKAGLLDHGIENYINQVWKHPNRITKQMMADIQSGKLQTSFQFARRRIFESLFEGEQKGYVPATKDISALIAVYDQAFHKALSARAFIAAIRNGKTAGGDALVKFSGMQTEIPAVEGESAGAYLIRARAIPELAVTKDGRSYESVNHPGLRGWRFLVQDPATGKPVYYQTDMLVHPDYAPKVRLPGSPLSLKSILEPSALRHGGLGVVTHPLLKIGAFAKQTKLSLSLFHLDQEGLHGLFHRIDPAHLEELNPDDPTQAMLIRNGLVALDYRAQELMSEGVRGGGAITSLPGLKQTVGRLQTAFNEFLFRDYIPRLKMTMALHAFERNTGRRAFKGLTPDQVAEITANQANAAFGELNYRLLGRSQTMQDALRLTLLAPDFLEARSRFVGQAMKRYGGEQRAALILGSAITYTGARIMNQFLDNDPHWDKPFSVIYNKREYRLRTVMGDLGEVMTDPGRFFNNRLSPWLKEGITVATQRDMATGLKLTRFEQLKHALAWLVPISVGGTEQANVAQRFLGSAGVTNKPAKGAINDVYDMARAYRTEVAKQDPQIASEVERAGRETYAGSDYARLNAALYENDRERIVQETEKLIETKGSDNVEQYYDNLPEKTFTGSEALEDEWLRGLANDPARLARYHQAVADRDGMARLFFQLRPYARPKRDISLTPVR